MENWLEELRKQGIKFCILSNSNKVDKVKGVAEQLGIPFIYFAKKPLRSGFRKAQIILDLPEENIAMVGDQIMTDIIGANRCHMLSILVKPIEEKEYLITKIKRPFEKRIIKKYQKMRENKNVYK